jgi:hypothetical protein
MMENVATYMMRAKGTTPATKIQSHGTDLLRDFGGLWALETVFALLVCPRRPPIVSMALTYQHISGIKGWKPR